MILIRPEVGDFETTGDTPFKTHSMVTTDPFVIGYSGSQVRGSFQRGNLIDDFTVSSGVAPAAASNETAHAAMHITVDTSFMCR